MYLYLKIQPFMSNRRFKKGGQVAKSLFWQIVCKSKEKKLFSALFFRETAVQFQIKYDELQNPKTFKQHYGGCFWSNMVGKLWIFMFGAIFGEIRTWWARTRHFQTSFELLLDAKPCFLLCPIKQSFANIYMIVSTWNIQAFWEFPLKVTHLIYCKIVLRFAGMLPINNSYVVTAFFYCKRGSTNLPAIQ